MAYPGQKMDKVTIKDVAKECGVSSATVSYVLNGKRVLLPETREKVMRVMREMNYHPSAVAQGLSRKRMNTLGILFGVVDAVAVVTHSYASSILQGVLTAAAAAGQNVTFFTAPWRTARQSAAGYRDRRADGVIVVAPSLDSDIISGLAPLHVPLAAISFPGGAFGVPSVDVDNAQGAWLAVDHLRGLGHTRIAHLSGPDNMFSGQIRREAFCAAMMHGGAGMVEASIVVPGEFDALVSYQQTRKLLTRPDRPTAIFAANDESARGAMDAARELGIFVPGQLSIVGFDDTPEGAMARPGLTSVRQPLQEMGETAARLLMRQIEGETVASDMTLLAPALVIRQTSAPPA